MARTPPADGAEVAPVEAERRSRPKLPARSIAIRSRHDPERLSADDRVCPVQTLAKAGMTSRPNSSIISAMVSKLPKWAWLDEVAGNPAPKAAWTWSQPGEVAVALDLGDDVVG